MNRALLLPAAFVAGLVAGCVGFAAVGGHAQSGEVVAALREASAVWGVPYARLECVARRESTFGPGARSPGGHLGLYQFLPSTFAYAHRTLRNPGDPRYPLLAPDATPWRARDAALAAAGMMARGEGHHWSTFGRCR